MKQGSPADCFIEISSVERGNENAVGGISRRPAEGCWGNPPRAARGWPRWRSRGCPA